MEAYVALNWSKRCPNYI